MDQLSEQKIYPRIRHHIANPVNKPLLKVTLLSVRCSSPTSPAAKSRGEYFKSWFYWNHFCERNNRTKLNDVHLYWCLDFIHRHNLKAEGPTRSEEEIINGSYNSVKTIFEGYWENISNGLKDIFKKDDPLIAEKLKPASQSDFYKQLINAIDNNQDVDAQIAAVNALFEKHHLSAKFQRFNDFIKGQWWEKNSDSAIMKEILKNKSISEALEHDATDFATNTKRVWQPDQKRHAIPHYIQFIIVDVFAPFFAAIIEASKLDCDLEINYLGKDFNSTFHVVHAELFGKKAAGKISPNHYIKELGVAGLDLTDKPVPILKSVHFNLPKTPQYPYQGEILNQYRVKRTNKSNHSLKFFDPKNPEPNAKIAFSRDCSSSDSDPSDTSSSNEMKSFFGATNNNSSETKIIITPPTPMPDLDESWDKIDRQKLHDGKTSNSRVNSPRSDSSQNNSVDNDEDNVVKKSEEINGQQLQQDKEETRFISSCSPPNSYTNTTFLSGSDSEMEFVESIESKSGMELVESSESRSGKEQGESSESRSGDEMSRQPDETLTQQPEEILPQQIIDDVDEAMAYIMLGFRRKNYPPERAANIAIKAEYIITTQQLPQVTSQPHSNKSNNSVTSQLENFSHFSTHNNNAENIVVTEATKQQLPQATNQPHSNKSNDQVTSQLKHFSHFPPNNKASEIGENGNKQLNAKSDTTLCPTPY